MSHVVLASPITIDASNLPRHTAQDEAARLKAEILQQGHELAKLERLAGTVQATRLDAWPRADAPTSSAGRSTSTGKIIDQLQREIDHLRLTSQAASRSLESERRANEVLRIKCDDLELSINALRAENHAHAQTLQRSDKALKNSRNENELLSQSLLKSQTENDELVHAAHETDIILANLRQELSTERQAVMHTSNQYQILSNEFALSIDSSRKDLSILRQDLDTFLAHFREEQLQIWTAKEDIILLNDQQLSVEHSLVQSQEKLSTLRVQQVAMIKEAVAELSRATSELGKSVNQKYGNIDSLQAQLRAIESTLLVAKT